ncbi:MAG TPA: hypothetical protein VGD90_03160 [Sphingobacteriaceae bacterium]
MENSIYAKYIFKDKSNDQLIRELVINSNVNPSDKIIMTIRELMEQYSLAESDIKIEN